jgi:hypothetical protein
MRDEHAKKPELLSVSGIHLAEIRIRMLTSPASSATVAKVLELKDASSLDSLDGLTLLNLLHHLRSL